MINGVEQLIHVEQLLEKNTDIKTAMGKNADILSHKWIQLSDILYKKSINVEIILKFIDEFSMWLEYKCTLI